MYRLYFLLLFFSMTSAVQAQDITTSKIRWNVSQVFNVSSGEITTDAEQIISDVASITWMDQNGLVKHTYSISSTVGQWTNVNHTGSFIYKVSSGNANGNVEIWRRNGELKIRIIVVDENSTQIFELQAQNFNIL